MIGTKLAHYELLEELGRGGMGVVYKARDTRLDRFVAVKVLPAEKVAHRERQQRFVQEAKSASALNHPNIVTVYDIAEEDGTSFIAIEYVAGKTLAELIPRQGMRLGEVLKHAVQIASALTAAHQGGIVHRDLKPGNVIVGDDGRLRLVDFGLAKLVEADSDSDVTLTFRESGPQTQEGTILGTAAYMSPEQAVGRAVDARSDIFSLGSLLYEMATGRSAFQGDSAMSTLGAIIHKEPEPLPPEVPHDLQKLIERCLRKDVARRYQHMADVKVVLEELKDASDSGTLVATPITAPTTQLQSPRAALWRRASVLGPVLAVAVLALAAWWWRPQPSVETAPLVPTPLTSYPGIEQTPALSPSGEQVAFSWNGESQDNFDIYVRVVGAEGTVRLTDDPAFDWAPTWS
ncbi:MAG: protein kinase, partial [Acidobacteriota bacterium]